MARQMTPATLGGILAGAGSVLILGYMGFLLFPGTQATAVPVPTSQYDTSVIVTELSTTNDKSIFLSTVPLTAETTNTSGGVQYDPSELGKTDITQIGR